MAEVPGTRGYAASLDAFVGATTSLDFEVANAPFLGLLPRSPARILDAGAGIGQNAAALARRGHAVVAVEPVAEFLDYARRTFSSTNIDWRGDSLPDLKSLDGRESTFDFILVQAVWHHLDEKEREAAMARLSALLRPAGICAISLRHGPAGVGSRVFPVCADRTTVAARAHGLEVALRHSGQPSLLPGKPAVTWTHIAFRRTR